MAKVPSGFPLKKHRNGQWYAYLKGKIRYFGSGDAMDALADYQKRLVGILNGDEDREKILKGRLTVGQMITLFLEHLQQKIKTGEISSRRVNEYRRIYIDVFNVFGSEKRVAAVTQSDCQKLREVLSQGCKLQRLAEKIKRILRMVEWAYESDYLEALPKFKKWLDLPGRGALKREKDLTPHFFTAEEILQLSECGGKYPLQWKAVILTAINCGFGSRDLAELEFSQVDLQKGFIAEKRGKTGMGRKAALWPETVAAIKEYLEKERPETELKKKVFVTSEGTLWNYDTEKSRVDSLGLAFRRTAKKLGLREQSFYSLRRTFRTIADETGDVPAINLIMGHADYTMGGVYRQFIKDDRLVAVSEYVRKWLMGNEHGPRL